MKKLLLVLVMVSSLFANVNQEECNEAFQVYKDSSSMARQYERAGRYDKANERHTLAKDTTTKALDVCKLNKVQKRNLKNIIKEITAQMKKNDRIAKAYKEDKMKIYKYVCPKCKNITAKTAYSSEPIPKADKCLYDGVMPERVVRKKR